MTRQEYLNQCKSRSSVRVYRKNVLPSVTDPSMAQSGRDLLFNPKPINYDRCDYYKGLPVDQMRSFDQMYAQKMDVFNDAKELSTTTKKQLDKLEKEYEKSKNQPAPQDNQ